LGDAVVEKERGEGALGIKLSDTTKFRKAGEEANKKSGLFAKKDHKRSDQGGDAFI